MKKTGKEDPSTYDKWAGGELKQDAAGLKEIKKRRHVWNEGKTKDVFNERPRGKLPALQETAEQKTGMGGKQPTVAVLFAGGGGDTLGFVSSGFKLAFANDNNLDACGTLRNNFESGTRIIHHSNIQKMEDFAHSNVISGGFPCQGFSAAGPRKVADRRNTLYRDLKRAIQVAKPEFFVAENVKGFVTIGEHGRGKFFKNGKIARLGNIARAIINELADIGYVVHYDLHNAKDYGLPQDRSRIIIVGVREDLDYSFKFPTPTHDQGNYVNMEEYGVRDIEADDSEIFREAKGSRKDYFSSRYMSRNRIRRWDQISFTIPAEASQVPACPDCASMWGMDAPRVKDSEIVEFYKDHAGDISKDLVRMSWRQCAAIQGFPKNYKFSGDLKSIYKQIGNAVPPPLMQRVAECIMPYFKGQKSSY